MNIRELMPLPRECEAFQRHRCRYVPEESGCYVLTTFLKEVLYIGLAINLRRRINQHLDDVRKIKGTSKGRAVFLFWLKSRDINKIERTWMNIHIQHEGKLPSLNYIYSPTQT